VVGAPDRAGRAGRCRAYPAARAPHARALAGRGAHAAGA